MAKGTTYANDYLKLIFQNDNIANIGDATGVRGSSADGNLYLSLHTADPASGNQTTSETSYTSYARVAVPRDNTGFTVSGATVTLAADASFPQCTGSGQSVTHWAVGTASSGTGKVLYSGLIGPSLNNPAALVISTGMTPKLLAATQITEG